MARTLSIWRWQLIFTAGVATIVVVIAAFEPEMLARPLVAGGLVVIIATSMIALAVPWSRLPHNAAVILPLLDALGIGLTVSVPEIRLGFLWVFPIMWIATYFSIAWIIVGIAFIAVLLAILAGPSAGQSEVILRVLSVLFTLSFLGGTISLGARRSRAARRLLIRQSEQANRAAQRAQTQQARVTQIIDALDMALVVVDDDARILKMNDAYRRLYGRDIYGAMLPSAAVEYDAHRGTPLPQERSSLRRAAAGDRLDGERIWLFDGRGLWRALDVSTEQLAGTVDGERTVLVIIADVTDVLDAAEERRALTAVVSHELRNPLTAIIGHVDLLSERTDLPERAMAQLRVVENAAMRMQALITGALEGVREEPEPYASVELRQIIDASAASFAPIIAGSGLSLGVRGADTLHIDGDAFRLRQVFDNLLSNAVKYTPAGGVVVVELVSGDLAEVVVSDTGSGMTSEELRRVFEPYFRSPSAVRGAIPGTGLGMGITRDIVAAHDGTIDVLSSPDAGTTVTVRFPRSASSEAPE